MLELLTKRDWALVAAIVGLNALVAYWLVTTN
jgi:hypothetical protein